MLGNETNVPVTVDAAAFMPANRRSRLQIMQDLTKNLPKNEYGLPSFLYRPDLIPDHFDELDPHEKEQILLVAAFDIQYVEGFPALSDGTPLWGQLPFEDMSAYSAFGKYMNLAESFGVRRVDLITDVSRQALIEYHTYYYWSLRCRARDLFEIAAAQKMRERRILRTNDRHFLEAEKILGKVLTWFGKMDEDGNPIWEKDLTPKVAMDMLDKLAKMQRVSLGLPAHGHSSGEHSEAPANAGMELILRTIAEKAGSTNTTTAGNTLDLLLNDPEAAMMAQELILKVNSGGKERTITEITDSPTTIADEIG